MTFALLFVSFGFVCIHCLMYDENVKDHPQLLKTMIGHTKLLYNRAHQAAL